MIKKHIFIFILMISGFCFSQTIEEKLYTFNKSIENNDCDYITKYACEIVDSKLKINENDYLKTLYKIVNCFNTIDSTIKYTEKIIHFKRLNSFDNDTNFTNDLENLAVLYDEINENSKAIKLYKECLDLTEKILGKEHSNYLHSLNNLAFSYYYLGKYSEALLLNQECVLLGEKILGEEHENYVRSINNLAYTYYNLGNYLESLKLNKQCVKLYKKILGENHPDYFVSLNNLAQNYSILGDYSNALNLNKECLELRKKNLGVEHPQYLTSLNNLALNYSNLGNYNEASKINIECLGLKNKILGKEHPKYLTTLNNLAQNYYHLGNYPKALELNLLCLDLSKKIYGVNHPDYLRSLNNLAQNYSELANYSKALELTLECLELGKKIYGENHPDFLVLMYNSANNYSEIGNYSKSLEINIKCNDLIIKILGKKHPRYLLSLINLAQNYSHLDNYKKAYKINRECIKLTKKILGEDHPDYIFSMHNLASIYFDNGNYSKALNFNLKCLQLTEKILGKEHPLYLSTVSNLAFVYISTKKYFVSDSLFQIYSILEINSYLRNLNGLNEDLKSISKYEIVNVFEFLSNYSLFRMSQNPILIGNTFDFWLNLNGIISNQSAQLESQIRASKDSSLIHLFEKWQLNKLQILKYYELTKPELEKRGINIIDLEEEINEQERALSRGSEVFSEMKKTYALSDIQQHLKEDEAYVDIVRLPYYNFNTNVWSDTIRYLAYIITKDTKEIPTTVLLENGNQLEEEIASYYAENTFGKSKREKDSISYAYFWKPISTALEGKRKVYLSSGGVYNNINVQTLFNPSTNKYVSEELDVHLINNGRTFIQQKTKKPQQYTNNTATFIGYPNFNGTLSKGSIKEDAIFATTREFSPMLLDTLSRGANVSPLPGTKKEVETIGQLLKTKQWNVTVLTENNASEEEIKNVESPRVLHIATHGYFLKQTDNLEKVSGLRMMGMDTKRFVENPLLRSGLLLSGANKTLKGDTTKASENGILTAYEAAYLHLQGTELVVLSACETGKGELKNGEGVYGLRKSFADAGAKNIIMSLWKVDDKVTQEFMTSFYTNWSTGITIREAFNKTQQSIKALYPQPYYWGAFILVGE
jgi:CHAT domain-containing protein